MKQSFFRGFAFAVMACVSLLSQAVAQVADTLRAAYKVVSGAVAHAFELAKPETEQRTPGILGKVEAKAFVRRIAQRERPVIEGSWRMCASV